MSGKFYSEMLVWFGGLNDITPSISRIRNFYIKKFGPACMECSWVGRNTFNNKWVIELDHIDGDRSNNTPANLRLLCPNCHALTNNYKSLNRASDRDSYGVCRFEVEDWLND